MDAIEQAREIVRRLSIGSSIARDRRIDHDFAGLADAACIAMEMLIAELAALKGQQAIGSVTVSPWRGLENIEWQQSVDIPEGTHMLYLAAGAQPVPAGYQLVPIEPTEAMLLAYTKCHTAAGFAWCKHQWKAMLEAAKEQS